MRQLLVCLLLGLLWFSPAFAAVDINSADSTELQTLPGIGESKAAAIIQYRTDHGPFATVDDLDAVPGIGPSTIASLRDMVTVGKGGKAADKPATTGGATAPAPAAAAPAPAAPSGACRVNINTADATQLQDLPGIGESKAAAILQHRTDNGPFASCDALDDVSGIGPATISGLRDCCVVK